MALRAPLILEIWNGGQEGGRVYFTVLITLLADVLESTLLVLYAFASRGQRFKQKKSSEKPKTKSEKKKRDKC